MDQTPTIYGVPSTIVSYASRSTFVPTFSE